MEHFARDVESRTSGGLKVLIYPSQQLGSERQLLELLQIGAIDITKVSTSVLEGFVPEFKILGLPYLFDNEKHRDRVLYGPIGRDLLDSSIPYYLKGLTFYDAGSRSFYTLDTPILHPDDLKGLKIRTQESPVAMNMVKAFGGSPTPIAWGELYTALQQGIVDGAENNPPSFYLSGHYEICKYYCLNEHTGVPDALFISTKTWEILNEKQREIILHAARESARVQKKLWDRATKEALEEVKKAGVKVMDVNKGPFRERSRALYEEYSKNETLNGYLERIGEASEKKK
jgi:tripartite ATP-independent transporter DctP family solute receptor